MSQLIYSGKNLPSTQLANFDALLLAASAPIIKPRPYTARITRANPTAFVFLLDQSGSMNSTFNIGGNTTKSNFLADAVNKLMGELISECRRGGQYQNYFDICVIGYGGDSENTAKYAWEGALEEKDFVKIEQLITHPIEQNGNRRKWISPTAKYQTPMKQALHLAHDTLVQWLAQYTNKDIFPPVVINVTDGVATDADETELIEAAQRLKSLRTTDGNVLLFNIHLAEQGDNPILFPCQKSELADSEYAHLLFDMSSDLPSVFNREIAKITKRELIHAYSAMAYNCNPTQLTQFLNIGTSVSRKNT